MAATPSLQNLVELDPVPPRSGDGDDTGPELCERCRQFDIQAFSRSEDRTCGYMLRDVTAAAAEGGGCPFCSLLLSTMRDVERPRDIPEMELNVFRLPINNDPSMYVHMTLCEDGVAPTPRPPTLALRANRLRTSIADRFSDVRNASHCELCLAAESDSAASRSGDITGRYLGREPSSDAHFDTVRAWIAACTKHPKCNQTVSGRGIDARQSELPTRCLKVSTDGPGLRVVLVPTEGVRGSYITLTHRWNDETERSRTTTANYDQRLQGIDLWGLPRLFRDVFAIAARLQVQHVWIDSICIIQAGDNGADWRTEAPKMAQYYQHSLFTIAGTMQDMQNGLLHPYPDESLPWESKLGLVRLPYRDRTGAPAGHFFVYKRRVPLVNNYWAAVRESILFRRGWILQEWLLSKRLLWYTSSGLFFECHTDGPRTEYQERILVEKAQLELQPQLQMKGAFHFDNPSILDFWYRAIELYSSCHLTKPDQDRILAVAGLAKEVGLILTSQTCETAVEGAHDEVYVAGLWLRDVHYGLLWEEDGSAPPWTTSVGQAPSWSWASLMTPVRWAERDKEAKTAFRVAGLCQTRRGSSHAHEPEWVMGRNGAVQRSNDHNNPQMQRATFDPTNMSACLHVRGRLRIVHLRGYLETERNLKAAAVATAYAASPSPSRWRALCSPARPEVIAGWASAERARASDEATACADGGIAVYVLHVSTSFARSGLLIKHRDPVLNVLLVEEVNGHSCVLRRLGVGRIFDTDLIAEFEMTERCDIQLV